MRLRLKLPPGDSAEETYQRCLLIRYQYMLWRKIATSRLDDTVAPDLSQLDFPAERDMSCLWYEIHKRVLGLTNPLWAIRYDYQQSLMHRKVLMLRPLDTCRTVTRNGITRRYTKKGTYDKVLVDPAKVNFYNEAGRGIGRDQMYAVKTTIAGLASSFTMGSMVLGTSDPVDLLEWLKSHQELDPVIELFWRNAKAIAYNEELLIFARLAYAQCPKVYEHLPQSWVEDKELRAYFGECDGTGYFAGVGMDGLFSLITGDLPRNGGSSGQIT